MSQVTNQSANKPLPILEQDVADFFRTRPAAVRRIGVFLFNRFAKHIDLSDLSESTFANKPRLLDFFLSRALAAHVASVLCDKDPAESAECVVDGGQDLGIDAICLDPVRQHCYLIQSWFNASGSGNASQTDMLKCIEGFQAIVSDDFQRGNQRILSMQVPLRTAVNEVGWKFTLVFASTAAQPISGDFEETIQSRLSYHDPGNCGTFSFHNFPLNKVTESIERAFDPKDINLTITLNHWGCVTKPVVAYYGQVPLADIIQWRSCGSRLFEKNLRNFDPSSEVSESIRSTIADASSEFWYRNNGATMLCKKIERLGPYQLSTSREAGNFFCTGASIVNGAQTIGAIWEHAGNGETLEPDARMHLRLISLEDADEFFGKRVTTGTNTQKNIRARDFATFDETQVAIQRQFQMDGRVYVIRETDVLPSENNGCTIVEAAIALACNHSVELATIAYRNVGFLTDPNHKYHKEVFSGANADRIFTLVKVLRMSGHVLTEIKEQDGRLRMVASHGARYIQYRVFSDAQLKQYIGSGKAVTDLEAHVRDITFREFARVEQWVKAHWQFSYPQVFFKNTESVLLMHREINSVKEGAERKVQLLFPLESLNFGGPSAFKADS